MQTAKFEWNDNDAQLNWHKHGVTFEQAAKAIRDKSAIREVDDREDYGKERWNLIGMCDGILLCVTYTERSKRFRIISARKATKHERYKYYHQCFPR